MQQQEKHNLNTDPLWKLTKSYKQGYQPNVEQGLVRLKGRIREDATPSKVVYFRQWLSRAAAILLLVIGVGFIYQNLSTEAIGSEQLVAHQEMIHSFLPDGSEVFLNKNSQLSYPTTFEGASKRFVQLDGEAFFKVSENAKQPFIVKTTHTEVAVLGTSFNLRAYASDPTTTLKVEEGKVAFKAPSTPTPIVVTANQKAEYDENQQVIETSAANHWKDTAWKTSKLTFDNTPLSEILSYLKDNFNTEVQLTSPQLSTCTLTATLVDNRPDAILKRIKSTFQIQLEVINSRKYRINGFCQ